MVDFEICFAEIEDTELLVNHRLHMWNDIHPELEKQVQEMEERTRCWIKKKMSEGRLIGFIAKTHTGPIAGSGCICLRDQALRIMTSLQQAPYLMSMFTEKRFRRKGVARLIVKSAIDWSRENGYNTIYLNAFEPAIPLYSTFGFQTTTEMRLML